MTSSEEFYEFPGGMVETGEGLSDALIREVREETGLTVREIGRYVRFFDYDSEDGERRRVFNFHVDVREPLKIRLTEHDRLVRVGKANLTKLELTEPIPNTLRLFWSQR